MAWINKEQGLGLVAFLGRSVVVGLAAAFVLLWFYPAALQRNGTAPPAVVVPTAASFHDAVRQVGPAVVNVYATRARAAQTHPLLQDPLLQRFFGETQGAESEQRDFGSGVILRADGHLLTNAHIIENAEEIQVTLPDGRQTTAEIVGTDGDTELAVLKLADAHELPVAPAGDSGTLRVGDVVLAIGNPYDFGQTVTQGIVSATGRKSLGITTFEDFIQTDADINPGNSGGALINAAGQVVGINTANYSDTGTGTSQGIGFAIPINLAMEVMRQLIDYGYVIRGWIGIEAQIVPRNIMESAGLQPGGVLVAGVLQGSPAARAGIRPGDILTAVDGQPLSDPRQAIQLVSQYRPGAEINITMLRGWEQASVRATVGERPHLRRR
jgi:Do/DeqQ family serine protease